MSDHIPNASFDRRRLRPLRNRSPARAADPILRSRLRMLLAMLALAVAVLVGDVGAVSAAGAPSRVVWSAAAAVAVLCAAVFVLAGRRMLAVVAEASQEHDAYAVGVQGRLHDLEGLIARGWWDVAGLLGQLSVGEPALFPLHPPVADAVVGAESADPFDQVSQAVARGRDETLASLARVIALQETTTGSSDQSEQVEVFVYIARRLHALVTRALASLDVLEKDVEDPGLLHSLFRVDHLVTQTRRQVENLAVLGGEMSRRINTPVLLSTVLRQAGAEIEHYTRVRVVMAGEEKALPGYAATDVIHLLAELAENATKFSDTETLVLLTAQLVPAGLAIEVEDRGLHMSPATLARMNRLLAAPDEVDLRDQLRDGRIGLLVSARIAQRHNIRVELRANLLGGTQALVVLPPTLLTSPGKAPAPRSALSEPAVPAPALDASGARALAAAVPAGKPVRSSVPPVLPQRRRHASPAPSSVPTSQAAPPRPGTKPLLPRREGMAEAAEPVAAQRQNIAPAPATAGLMATYLSGVARGAEDTTPPVPRPPVES